MAAQMGFNVARAAMSGSTDLAEKNVSFSHLLHAACGMLTDRS